MTRTSRTIPLALLLLAAGGCAGYEPYRKNFSDGPTAWGPVSNGLQVGVARRTYEGGKAPSDNEAFFVVQMRNVGPRPLTILAPTDIDGTPPEPRAGDESACLKLNYGAAAGATKPAEFRATNKPVIQVMEPAKVYNLEMRLSPEKFGARQFDGGRLSAAYVNAQASITYQTSGSTVADIWTGEAKSGDVALNDAPPK
jgi:hypothetical protein